MKKCVLLVRVSTDHQSFDEQSEELRQLALADGYNSIITIAEIESGIKLKEEERKGLNKLKEYIKTDPEIDCVYVWEISRLARKMNVLMSLKEFLISNGIQLRIKEPSLTLLLPDGTPDPGADIVFNLYGTLAEQEMRNKKARFRRTKVSNGAKGLTNGGRAKFGYKIVDGKYTVNEEESKVVRLIFDLYINTDMSVRMLEKELYERGYRNREGLPFYNRAILCILHDKAYTGENIGERSKIKRIYPVIITEEEFDTAARRREEKTNYKRSSTFRYLLGQKLIICPKCGRYYVAQMCSNPNVSNAYRCGGLTPFSKLQKDKCENTTSITIERFDALIWPVVMYREIVKLNRQDELEISKIEDLIEVKKQKIVHFRRESEKLASSMDRASEMYINGYITKEKFLKSTEGLKEKHSEIEKAIETLDVEIGANKNLLLEIEASKLRLKSIGSVEKLFVDMNQKERFDLVHKHIKFVTVENDYIKHPRLKKTKGGEKYKAKKITIHFFDETIENYWFISALSRFKDLTPYLTDRSGDLEEYYTYF